MAFLSKSSDSKTNHAPANRSMVRLAALPLQAKLRMGKPHDAYEQEANRVADRVMGMSEAQVQRQTDEEEVQTQPLVSQIKPLVQRQPEEEKETAQTLQRQEEEEETAQTLQRQEEEEETAQTLQRQPEEEEETAQTLQRQPEEEEEETAQTLQRQEEEEETAQAKTFTGQTPRISANLESRIQSQRGGGQPLPESTRNFFEPRFGTNFSGVRVHTDAEANSLSREINARAFTVGRDIFVGSGQYNPYSSAGRHLLAHELTHTVQQGAVVRRQPVTISQHTPSPMVQGDWFGIRNKVEKYADKIPGYFLFKVILGKSPITKKEVPPTGINILRGVLTLIPVLGEQWFKQLKKTGAADKAGAWLDKEIKKLDIWRGINAVVAIVNKGLRQIWKKRRLIKEIIAATVSRVRRFIRNVSGKIKEFIIAGALKLAGSAGEKVLAVFKKAKDVFAKILDNPLLFIKNFLSAFAQGFSQFSKNILKHLKGGIFGWLLGSLSSAGVDIRIPKKFDLKSIFGLVAQVLGFTYEAIKLKLTKKLGPKANKLIELLEKYVGFVKELVTKGPIVLWEKVKQSLGNLKQMVFDKLKQWVVFQVIGKAVTKLLLMMNPAGALLAVAEAIYKVVMFFIDRWEQIKGLVVSIFGSIRDIAFGNLKKAVAYVEKVLATGLTLVISFMARYVGLGGIGKEVQKILKAIRKPIDRAMERVISWLVKKAKALWKRGKATAKKLIAWWKKVKFFQTKQGDRHKLFFKGKRNTAKLMMASNGGKEYGLILKKLTIKASAINLKLDQNSQYKELQKKYAELSQIRSKGSITQDDVENTKKKLDIISKLHISIENYIETKTQEVLNPQIDLFKNANQFFNYYKTKDPNKLLSQTKIKLATTEEFKQKFTLLSLQSPEYKDLPTKKKIEKTKILMKQANDANGFYHRNTNLIYLKAIDIQTIKDCVVHEIFHLLSDKNYPYIMGEEINEGTTVYYTQLLIGDKSLTRGAQHIQLLEKTIGETRVRNAYFQGQTESLADAINQHIIDKAKIPIGKRDTQRGCPYFELWRGAVEDKDYYSADQYIDKTKAIPDQKKRVH